ncbi:unnamed protein product [Alopecurus aequalis]
MEEEGARRPRLGPDGGGADLISALPEDLLLHVLRRLRCARAAARTSLLSRHWRGLWTRLPDLIFRDIPVRSIQAALSVSLLEITLTSLQAAVEASVPGPQLRHKFDADLPSLLHAAAGLSPPPEFHLALRGDLASAADADLPGFHRTTSIQLYAQNLRLTMSGAYPKLQKLTLSGCCVDVAAVLLRCPCLRVLRVNEASLDVRIINIQSRSLQKLSVRAKRGWHIWTDYINVEAPMLEQLAVSICTGTADLSVSVVAPILDKLSWECSYDTRIAGLAGWGLSKVRLYAADSFGQRVVTSLQLSNAYLLSLQMSCDWNKSEPNFMNQIEKHLVTDFSILDLTMGCKYTKGSAGHVFGPFVLHLLAMPRFCNATRRLQIHFLRPEVKEGCLAICRHDEPGNWRSKNISLINLEEVELDGFNGEDHEFDLLKVIFRCAPILKRMAIRTSDEVRTSDHQCTKLQEIFKVYPFVECKLNQR